MKKSFIERTLNALLVASRYAANAEQLAIGRGALQTVDARVKVAGLFGLIVAVAASRRLEVIGGVFIIALTLAIASRIRIAKIAQWVWTPVLLFTGAIALPALFLVPGPPAFDFVGLTISHSGLRSAAFLISRAETASTLSALLALTTPWPSVLKALRTFKCPVVLVAILGMTYRYIFVILKIAYDTFEARKSRTVGSLPPRESRRLATATAGVVMTRSIQLSHDVHLAMQSRGFRGEIHILRDFHASGIDWCWLSGFAALIAAGMWLGR
jgi:cobalt/nickel transport system permease protein